MAGGDGRVWRVRRRWVPRLGTDSVWRRFRRRVRSARERATDAADLDPGCLDLVGEGIAVAVVVILVVLAVVFIGLPLLVAVVDLVIVLLLALLGVVARVLFRRPWVVEAVSDEDEPEVLTWRVVGWRTSGAKVDEVADRLEAGLSPSSE